MNFYATCIKNHERYSWEVGKTYQLHGTGRTFSINTIRGMALRRSDAAYSREVVDWDKIEYHLDIAKEDIDPLLSLVCTNETFDVNLTSEDIAYLALKYSK